MSSHLGCTSPFTPFLVLSLLWLAPLLSQSGLCNVTLVNKIHGAWDDSNQVTVAIEACLFTHFMSLRDLLQPLQLQMQASLQRPSSFLEVLLRCFKVHIHVGHVALNIFLIKLISRFYINQLMTHFYTHLSSLRVNTARQILKLIAHLRRGYGQFHRRPETRPQCS